MEYLLDLCELGFSLSIILRGMILKLTEVVHVHKIIGKYSCGGL